MFFRLCAHRMDNVNIITAKQKKSLRRLKTGGIRYPLFAIELHDCHGKGDAGGPWSLL